MLAHGLALPMRDLASTPRQSFLLAARLGDGGEQVLDRRIVVGEDDAPDRSLTIVLKSASPYGLGVVCLPRGL